MLNLKNSITLLQYQFSYNKDKLIIPDNTYRTLCDKFPSKHDEHGLFDFKEIDGYLHRITGANVFAFCNTPDELFVWNEKRQIYE